MDVDKMKSITIKLNQTNSASAEEFKFAQEQYKILQKVRIILSNTKETYQNPNNSTLFHNMDKLIHDAIERRKDEMEKILLHEFRGQYY